MALNPGEQPSGGWIVDADGRQSVSIQGGTGAGGGGGGDPLSDGVPGGALPTRTLWVAGADGTVLRGIAVNASGHVLTAVQNFPATQAVSDGGGSLTVDGTVTANAGTGPWPVTDNGGTLSVDDGAGSLTVDGAVSVSNFPASQAVTGTFFQATQPVSAAALPLPAGAAQEHATAASPHSARLTDGAAFYKATTPADTQPVSLSTLPAGTNQIGTTLGPAVTKGTQGATGYTTQDLKDAGRQQVMLSWLEVAGTANVESALTNFSAGTRNATALTAASSYTVSAGKTLRIQEIHCYVKATSTVNNVAFFRIRQAPSGIANTSPIIWVAVQALELATVAAGALEVQVFPIPDGLEVAAGQQITFTWLTTANTCTLGFVVVAYEY